MVDFSPICEPTSRQGQVLNQVAVLPLGSLWIVRALGSPIELESGDARLAHLVMPYRGEASGNLDRPGFNSAAQGALLYAPPGLLAMETEQTAGIVTIVEPEVLLQTALAMVGADHMAFQIHAALASPRRIAIDCEPNRQLAHVLYSLYQNLDPLVSLGGDILHHSRLDDQILRLWVLLLIPELHAAPAALRTAPLNDGASAWVKELADWIAVHADRPLTLADLERQSGYSRRSLQLAFRTLLDCSPMQWVKRCRMQKARERLVCPLPGDSIGSVAKFAGFVNAAAFTRDFVRFYGEKPSAVLRQARRSAMAFAVDHSLPTFH